MSKLLVHPNSAAARKWGRFTWTTTLPASARAPGASRIAHDDHQQRALFIRAARAARSGNSRLAQSLRAKAMRDRSTTHHCG